MRLLIIFVATLASLFAHVFAANFQHSCYNYYLDNGVVDGTHELYLEAFCSGGTDEEGNERSRLCSRLNLEYCYKAVNGAMKPYEEDEEITNSLSAACEIDSCAIMRDAWDGPIMTCQCRDDSGNWRPTTIDMNAVVGNEGGLLQCGESYGSLDCPEWGPYSTTFLPEEDL
ncbi:hypothetical protein J7T55_012276 [Diaporthe amygdali]|uniref:uncharacterized protein n=1 Tax=Phomopsis amygdali TaxID=1214568 RepID=UPI0022FEE3EE|nr:uncharacterized protein J7T55_012276 [Diaporthe amygdali]KAJ0123806.1 hypothetical protein J7T55_012276 [Diaporthe amygdali]